MKGSPNSPGTAVRVQHHPAVVAHQASSAADIQLRMADAITKFAGSMTFVYLHAIERLPVKPDGS